jgi:hypothetical protein
VAQAGGEGATDRPPAARYRQQPDGGATLTRD